MKSFLNYFGQFRLYSALDLLLLLLASRANNFEIAGALLLNFGFMAHLEILHRHNYRNNMPFIVPIILYVPGLVLFGKLEGIIYILLSHLYGLKKNTLLGLISPVLRGLQTYVLIGAVAGYTSTLAVLGLFLLILRNFIGDARDVSRDRAERIKTLPAFLGLKTDIKYGHLITLFVTTIVWWSFTEMSWVALGIVLVVEGVTYYWTPRKLVQNTA